MSLALAPALWGLLLLPVLVVLRILDRRPRVVVVPSLIPWRPAAAAEPPAGRRSLLLDWPLLLQMAAVGAAVLAAAGPRLAGQSRSSPTVAVVLDNSASMGAQVSRDLSRLEKAVLLLGRELKDLPGRRVLALSAPEPRVVVGPEDDEKSLLAALVSAKPAEAPGDLLGAAAAARAAAGPDALVLVASDNLSPLEKLPAENLIAVRVGAPVRNLGIVAAAVEDGRVFAAVRNASERAGPARLALLAGDKELAVREATLAPAERRGFTFPLPADARGLLELRLPPDDLAADNVVRLSVEPPPRPAFLGRPAPSVERALGALGFPEGAATPADPKLVVACGAWPPAPPPGGFALVSDPPEGGLGGIEAGKGSAPAQARLGEGEPEFFPGAGDYSFRIPAARSLVAGPGGRLLLGTPEQPLIVLAADGSACVLAFDPEATEWVKHGSFPVFLARLSEKVPAFRSLRWAAKPTGLLSEEETACRVAGNEVRRASPAPGRAGARGAELAPWLFALALVLLAGEWWLAARGKSS